jgi:hypothetical protein
MKSYPLAKVLTVLTPKPTINRRIPGVPYTVIIILISTMSVDKNPTEQAKADALPNQD